eukprot:CAMPEP_0194412550 /NCGR_PEP_ID=MMETSP0176-20130528/11034_1 /TAXON_ID=216777 /ORGANISM="Proboscia alata, Strain PI-D3" /LENGTH=420 /DNA_ID=CAMNT_0039215371 /DNA_START=263 /DNA_END=1525 /DNA_ORIENTATION=-
MEKKNALVFTPKGFHQEITLQYPQESRSLIVCKKCKKNYKSRYICRKKNRHTGLPWTDTYICVFIHESCLVRLGSERKIEYVRDKVIAGQVVEGRGFDMNMSHASTDLPVCSSCKHNNYTRSYCRKQKQHRHLPWNTEYAVLYASDEPVFAEPSAGGHVENMGQYPSFFPSEVEARGEEDTGVHEREESINDINDSRAFLLTVSCTSSSLKWLEPNNAALRNIFRSTLENPSMSIHRSNMIGKYDYASHLSGLYPTKMAKEIFMPPNIDNGHAIVTHNHKYFAGESNDQIPQNYPPYNYYPYHHPEHQSSYTQTHNNNFAHYDGKQWNNYSATINGHEALPYYAQYQPPAGLVGHREDVSQHGYFQSYQNEPRFPDTSERPRIPLPPSATYPRNETIAPRQLGFQHDGRPIFHSEEASSG